MSGLRCPPDAGKVSVLLISMSIFAGYFGGEVVRESEQHLLLKREVFIYSLQRQSLISPRLDVPCPKHCPISTRAAKSSLEPILLSVGLVLSQPLPE
jgi:hypothetical protein